MSNANLLIAAGTLLIAIGGLIATYGWNLRSSAETRQMLAQESSRQRAEARAAMLRTLAAELLTNSWLITTPPIAESDERKLDQPATLPRMQLAALQSAMASGLFGGPEDRELFTAILQLLGTLGEFNGRLALAESQILAGHAGAVRAALRDSPFKDDVQSRMRTFGALLVARGADLSQPLFGGPALSGGRDSAR